MWQYCKYAYGIVHQILLRCLCMPQTLNIEPGGGGILLQYTKNEIAIIKCWVEIQIMTDNAMCAPRPASLWPWL